MYPGHPRSAAGREGRDYLREWAVVPDIVQEAGKRRAWTRRILQQKNQSDTAHVQTEYHPEKNPFVLNRKELAAFRIETKLVNLVTIATRKKNFHGTGI
jgi:DNA-binding LytR/AlgR family response regulator